MKVLPTQKSYGPRGPATIGLNGKNLTISFFDPETRRPLGDNFEFPMDEVNLPPGIKLTPGDYFASVSRDGDKLYALRPLNATFVSKFVKFANQSDSAPPIPRRDTTPGRKKDGTSYPKDEMKFTALCQVIEGPWKGLEFPAPFIYARRMQNGGSLGFCDDGNGNLAIQGTGKDQQKLISFLEVTGIWGRECRFSSNVLPALEIEIQQEDRPFMVILRNGWPESYGEVLTMNYGREVEQPKLTKASSPTKKSKTVTKKKKK